MWWSWHHLNILICFAFSDQPGVLVVVGALSLDRSKDFLYFKSDIWSDLEGCTEPAILIRLRSQILSSTNTTFLSFWACLNISKLFWFDDVLRKSGAANISRHRSKHAFFNSLNSRLGHEKHTYAYILRQSELPGADPIWSSKHVLFFFNQDHDYDTHYFLRKQGFQSTDQKFLLLVWLQLTSCDPCLEIVKSSTCR